VSGRSRTSVKIRETKETKVRVELDLDESGEVRVETPVPFLNHMLHTMLFYANFRADVKAEDKQQYDDHHVVEDVAIVLGQALKEALGERRGIRRFSSVIMPMDEALVMVALDVSGRGMAEVRLRVPRQTVGGLSVENVPHFFWSLATNGAFTLHVRQIAGSNSHHIIEASFKGVGMAMGEAFRVVSSEVPSTKGSL
jgi:imidazoleglycerol-phosphate dehydratase